MKTKKQKIVYRIFFILLTMTALTISCTNKNENKEDINIEEETSTAYAVSTTKALCGELKDYLEFGGDVSAKTNIEIMPDAMGRLVELNVSVGSFVTKDQVIATVDPSRPGMNYAHSPVKAPISGTITALYSVEGSMVSQQTPVARVSKIDALQITMSVPERYVSKIKMNQKASLRFDAYPGENFEAIITEVSPVLDQASRSMNVKLAFVGQDVRIKAGMFARVKLITDTKTNIVTIPESSVINRFGEQFVFVIDDSNEEESFVKKQIIKPGIRVDDKLEVLEGLKDGDEIVVRGQTLLEEGSRVNVVN